MANLIIRGTYSQNGVRSSNSLNNDASDGPTSSKIAPRVSEMDPWRVPSTSFFLRVRVGFGLPGNTVLFLMAEAAGAVQDYLHHLGDVQINSPGGFIYAVKHAQIHIWNTSRHHATWGEMLAILSAVWGFMHRFNCFGSAVITILDDALHEIGHGTIGMGMYNPPARRERSALAPRVIPAHTGPLRWYTKNSKIVISIAVERYIAGNAVLYLLTEAVGMAQDRLLQHGDVSTHTAGLEWQEKGLRLAIENSNGHEAVWSEVLGILTAVWGFMNQNGYGSAEFLIYNRYTPQAPIGRGSIG